MKFSSRKNPAAAGISLADMLVTLAIVGIMAAGAVVSYNNIFERSSATVAQEVVETLNGAVTKYLQLEGTNIYDLTANDSSSEDEAKVLFALQVDDGTPGQPYMRRDYVPTASSSTEDYRAVWNGAYFELKVPGQAGSGFKIDFAATDLGRTPASSPDDFLN